MISEYGHTGRLCAGPESIIIRIQDFWKKARNAEEYIKFLSFNVWIWTFDRSGSFLNSVGLTQKDGIPL